MSFDHLEDLTPISGDEFYRFIGTDTQHPKLVSKCCGNGVAWGFVSLTMGTRKGMICYNCRRSLYAGDLQLFRPTFKPWIP